MTAARNWLRAVAEMFEDIRQEAIRAERARLRVAVEALAFEYDDDTPKRWMVERREVLDLLT